MCGGRLGHVVLASLSLVVCAPLPTTSQSATSRPPKGAIVLFDGKDTSAWVHRGTGEPCSWDVVDGCLVVKPGAPDIVPKREFGDYKLHVEFWLPLMADQT